MCYRSGMTMDLSARLQASMRHTAAARYDTVSVPPFTVYLHRSDPLIYFNYAIPEGPLPEDLREPLRRLRAVFEERGRVPRFEYVAELAPGLAGSLRDAGFRLEGEARLMVCTPALFTPVAVPEGISLSLLTPDSPHEDLWALCQTGRQGFSPGESYTPSHEEVARLREDLREGTAVLGRVDGQPAGVGQTSPPALGVAELAGVATLESARRRGLGTALTARLTQEAFARGVELLFLSTLTPEAGRIYERVGFRFLTSMFFFVDAALPEGALAPVP
jgi:GNAT superfamily N-acetyltransferase